MISTLPAFPKTYVLSWDPEFPEDVDYTPIVGWMHVQGNLAFPICAVNHGGLTHGRAIEFPCGMVTDPTHGLSFSSAKEWIGFIQKAKPKDGPEMPKPVETSAPEAKFPDSFPDDPEPGDVRDQHTVDAPPPVTEPEAAIVFGNKAFKTNSFWQINGRDGASLFQIAGGENYPKDARCEKITGAEFKERKAAGAPVVDPSEFGVEDDTFDLV